MFYCDAITRALPVVFHSDSRQVTFIHPEIVLEVVRNLCPKLASLLWCRHDGLFPRDISHGTTQLNCDLEFEIFVQITRSLIGSWHMVYCAAITGNFHEISHMVRHNWIVIWNLRFLCRSPGAWLEVGIWFIVLPLRVISMRYHTWYDTTELWSGIWDCCADHSEVDWKLAYVLCCHHYEIFAWGITVAPLTSLCIRRQWAPKNWVQSWHMFHYCFAITRTSPEMSHSGHWLHFAYSVGFEGNGNLGSKLAYVLLLLRH